MRLIDADALKNKFVESSRYDGDEVLEIIDKAPTVCNDNYSMGYQDGVRKVLSERPQGEWIDTGNMEEYWAEEYQCSICGAKDHWHKFCPNCGAPMKEVPDEVADDKHL